MQKHLVVRMWYGEVNWRSIWASECGMMVSLRKILRASVLSTTTLSTMLVGFWAVSADGQSKQGPFFRATLSLKRNHDLHDLQRKFLT
jgi:hypothetical protein